MPERTEAIPLTEANPAAFDPHIFSRIELRSVAGNFRDSFGQTFQSMARRAHCPPLFHPTKNLETLSLPPRAAFQLLDPIDTYGQEVKSKVDALPDSISAFDDRLEELSEQALLHGHSINAASRNSFLAFFKKNPLIRRGRLVLMENGNLRAVWKGENAAHIGLQFMSASSIQYVLFKHRKESPAVSRAYGRDSLEGVMRQIGALDLQSILVA